MASQVPAGTFGAAGAVATATGGPAVTVTSVGRTIPVEYTFLSNPDAKVEFYASCNLDTLFASARLLKVHDVGSGLRRVLDHGGVYPLMLQPGEYLGIRVVANRILGGASSSDAPGTGNQSVQFTKLTIGGVNMLASAQSGRRGTDLSAAEQAGLTASPAGPFALAPSIKMVSIVDPQRQQGGSDTEVADASNPVGYALAEATNPLRMGLGNPTIGTNSVTLPVGMSLFAANTAADASNEFDDSRFVLETFTDGVGAIDDPPVAVTDNTSGLATTRAAFRQP
jgi:hypothetical protein